MAESIYSDNSTFNIDSLDVLDYILIYNTVTFVNLEIIFNCDMKQIINKYPVSFALVNPSNTSTIYAQFTPSGSDFEVLKNTIPINGGLSSYTQSISYFTSRYVDNNHFLSNNSTLTSNTPTEGTLMQLRVTVNGVHKYFGTKAFNESNSNSMPTQSDTFNYLGNYSLNLNKYYLQNTDDVYLKIDNQRTVSLTINTIDNYSNTLIPKRYSNVDFIRSSTAIASFSGSNSYALTKTYNIISAPTQVTLWIEKTGISPKKIYPNLPNTSIHNKTQVGCTKLFNTTLKNSSSVSDTVYLEFPLFKELNGLSFTIQVNSTPNKVNFASTPSVTSLGNGKFKVDFSYSPTHEPNGTEATYTANYTFSFSHPSGISFALSASGFTFTNSTG